MHVNTAIFLDKDGTLVRDIPFNVEPSKIQLMPQSVAGLRAFDKAGFELIILSNQPGIAFGYFPEQQMTVVERRIRQIFGEIGISLSAFYFCPHHPTGARSQYAIVCHCRKPASGMIEQAARDHSIDLDRSWLLGDILDDIEAGLSAGCRTVLINNGNETEWKLPSSRQPNRTAVNINDAARIILREK